MSALLAFDIDLIVIDAELLEHAHLLFLIFLELGLEELDAVVRAEIVAGLIWFEELLTVWALFLIFGADFLMGFNFSLKDLLTAAILAIVWSERTGFQVFESQFIWETTVIIWSFLHLGVFILIFDLVRIGIGKAAYISQAAAFICLWLDIFLVGIRMVLTLLCIAMKPHCSQGLLDEPMEIVVLGVLAPVRAVPSHARPFLDAVAAVRGVAAGALLGIQNHLETDLAHEVIFHTVGGNNIRSMMDGILFANDLTGRELLKLVIVFDLLVRLLIVVISSVEEHGLVWPREFAKKMD